MASEKFSIDGASALFSKPCQSEDTDSQPCSHQNTSREEDLDEDEVLAPTNYNLKGYQLPLNQPFTKFPKNSDWHKGTEDEYLRRWEQDQLTLQLSQMSPEGSSFIIHDGPPYANGEVHLGNIYNKVLKDILARYKRMRGYRVSFIPGFDCHGLPVELLVSKILEQNPLNDPADHRSSKEEQERDKRLHFINLCRNHAGIQVGKQIKDFKDLGITAEWDRPYLTMDPSYQASVMRAFAKFVENGYVTHMRKTTPWCPSCQTSLANAEIEKKNCEDPSIYVLFPIIARVVTKESSVHFVSQSNQLLSLLSKSFSIDLTKTLEVKGPLPQLKRFGFLVWTTTPWSLPLNQALVINPKASYTLILSRENQLAMIIGSTMVKSTCERIGMTDYQILGECRAADIASSFIYDGGTVQLFAQHPLFHQQDSIPIILDEVVSLKVGTCCLHLAPACGLEDYLIGIKNKLSIQMMITPDGRFTEEISIASLRQKKVEETNDIVISILRDLNRVLHLTTIVHLMPHCWRCSSKLICRATWQFFCNLHHRHLLSKAIHHSEHKITFLPPKGKSQLSSTLSQRAEWCLSRQRTWGVPIPALICSCRRVFLCSEFICRVAEKVKTEGVEYWARLKDVADLSRDNIFNDSCVLRCDGCGNNKEEGFGLVRDVLDVWFDSGVSNWTVLSNGSVCFPPDSKCENVENKTKVSNQPSARCDVYIEGNDQHRGWFQSSLLCTLVLSGQDDGYQQSMTSMIISHGFILSGSGKKLSKSDQVVGSSLPSFKYVKAHLDSANFHIGGYKLFQKDALRYWCAMSTIANDSVFSLETFRDARKGFSRIRKTLRFALCHLSDFSWFKHNFPPHALLPQDQHALAELCKQEKRIISLYESFSISLLIKTIYNYFQSLRSSYFERVRWRLFHLEAGDVGRRSAQIVLYLIVDVFVLLLSPLLPFLCEGVHDTLLISSGKEEEQKEAKVSVHLRQIKEMMLHIYCPTGFLLDQKERKPWTDLERMREMVMKEIEKMREKNLDGVGLSNSRQAVVEIVLSVEGKLWSSLSPFVEEKFGNVPSPTNSNLNETALLFFCEYFDVAHFSFFFLEKTGKATTETEGHQSDEQLNQEKDQEKRKERSAKNLAKDGEEMNQNWTQQVRVRVKATNQNRCVRCWRWCYLPFVSSLPNTMKDLCTFCQIQFSCHLK